MTNGRVRRPPAERVDEPLRWLRANKHELGALTGTDARVLLAIAACWKLYCYTREDSVLRAVRELLRSMQPKCWRFAKALIPWAADWSDENEWWTRVATLKGDPVEGPIPSPDQPREGEPF